MELISNIKNFVGQSLLCLLWSFITNMAAYIIVGQVLHGPRVI